MDAIPSFRRNAGTWISTNSLEFDGGFTLYGFDGMQAKSHAEWLGRAIGSSAPVHEAKLKLTTLAWRDLCTSGEDLAPPNEASALLAKRAARWQEVPRRVRYDRD